MPANCFPLLWWNCPHKPTNVNYFKWILLSSKGCFLAQSFSRVQFFATWWSVTHQAPLSVGFPRQEYWIVLPLPTSGDLSDPETEPVSLCLLHCGGFFTTAPSGKSSFFKILEPKNGWIEERKACWEANRKEGQGSPNGGNRLQVSDFFFFFGEGNGTPLQYSFLENPMDGGAW